MAKVITVADLANKLVGKVTFGETFELNQGPIVEVYEENLPSNITMDIARDLNQYNQNFFHAHSEEAGTALSTLLKETPAIETIEAVTNCAGTKFGLFYSKPMNEDPTEEDFAASLGFGINVPMPQSIEKELRGKLAKLIMTDVDEDMEDEE